MDIEKAARQKNHAGRQEHRPNGGEFVGDPVVEAYKECLDGMNYAQEAVRRGVDLQWAREEFKSLGERLQIVHRTQKTPKALIPGEMQFR